jgi:uncharacterized membrane protein
MKILFWTYIIGFLIIFIVTWCLWVMEYREQAPRGYAGHRNFWQVFIYEEIYKPMSFSLLSVIGILIIAWVIIQDSIQSSSWRRKAWNCDFRHLEENRNYDAHDAHDY